MAKGRWVKIYTKILWDPTVRKLTAAQKWLFITLIILADEDAGKLSPEAADHAHLALASGLDVRTTCNGLTILEQFSLIMPQKCGGIKIPNWHKYQSTTAARAGRKSGKTPPLEVDKDKTREDKNRIDTIIEIWNSLPNLQQPVEVKPDDRKAVEFRLSEGATVEEIESVLTWYNGQLGSARSFWGGNNERGQPIKFNIKRVMKGKLSDKMTYVYEHFLAAIPKKRPEEISASEYKPPPVRDVEAGKLWADVLKQAKIGVKEIDTWLRPAVPIALTDETLTINVPSNIYANLIREKYLAELSKLAGREVEVVS